MTAQELAAQRKEVPKRFKSIAVRPPLPPAPPQNKPSLSLNRAPLATPSSFYFRRPVRQLYAHYYSLNVFYAHFECTLTRYLVST